MTIPHYSLSFDGRLPEMPPMLWTVTINARCLNCGGETVFAALPDGGTVLACQQCHQKSINQRLAFDEAVHAVLDLAAAKAPPPELES